MAYWRWPGSKPWVQTTVGMTQTADWAEGGGAGLLKFDDGTMWCWNGEMAHPAYEYYGWWAVINELAPGSKAWEQITPDYWVDMDGSELGLTESGTLIDDVMQDDHFSIAHDGGDKSFWFPTWQHENISLSGQWGVFVVSKESRTWEWKTLGYGTGNPYLEGLPVIWNGYVWYFTRTAIWNNPVYTHQGFLNRMDMEYPYNVTVTKTWAWTTGSSTAELVIDTNGMMKWFNHPFPNGGNDPATGVDDDGYFYWQANTPGASYLYGGATGLWRMKLPDGEWELLYYYQALTGFSAGSYNLPGGKTNDRWHGPLPIGIGFVANWWNSSLKVRDGWLYWVNNTGAFTMLSFGWTGGHTFCRMRLSDLEDGPVLHKPEDPIFEVLSMTTGGEDSFYNWDDTEYWGGTYKGHGGYGWRDGLNSIHAFVENQWFFDDDGSIVFLHHEYPNWYMSPNDYYPPWIISRLSPPQNMPITFNLVFEGSELKGYGHAREVPAKTKIGTIELVGE